jgi:ABC-type nitrate/sulfonate/bicarbonate transport system ATPase subunit
LARSLVTHPAALLLDAPLVALDNAAKARILDELRAWNAAHAIPIVFVTHAPEEAFALGEPLRGRIESVRRERCHRYPERKCRRHVRGPRHAQRRR